MFALTTVSHPERATVARMVTALAEVFGEALTETRLEGYLAALADVPTEALRAGLQHAMRTARFFPRPAELRSAVDAALAAQRALAPHVTDDLDPRVAVRCQRCSDDGWLFLGDRPDGKANTVQRCSCNPLGRAQRTYGEREREGR